METASFLTNHCTMYRWCYVSRSDESQVILVCVRHFVFRYIAFFKNGKVSGLRSAFVLLFDFSCTSLLHFSTLKDWKFDETTFNPKEKLLLKSLHCIWYYIYLSWHTDVIRYAILCRYFRKVPILWHSQGNVCAGPYTRSFDQRRIWPCNEGNPMPSMNWQGVEFDINDRTSEI